MNRTTKDGAAIKRKVCSEALANTCFHSFESSISACIRKNITVAVLWGELKYDAGFFSRNLRNILVINKNRYAHSEVLLVKGPLGHNPCGKTAVLLNHERKTILRIEPFDELGRTTARPAMNFPWKICSEAVITDNTNSHIQPSSATRNSVPSALYPQALQLMMSSSAGLWVVSTQSFSQETKSPLESMTQSCVTCAVAINSLPPHFGQRSDSFSFKNMIILEVFRFWKDLLASFSFLKL